MADKTNWNPGQLAAIEESQKGVVVSAAAGSGKTAVLVERTIRQLSDEQNGIPADRLLAVTFTNAAVAQLRDKLTQALSEKISENPDSEWLAKQQSRLQMAKIMTINAFSLEFVRNNCHRLGLQSNLTILEENDVAIIEREACEKAIDEFYQNEPDGMKSLIGMLCSKDSDIILCCLKLYHFLRSIPFSDDYMKKSISQLRDESKTDSDLEYISRIALDLISRARIPLEKALIIAQRMEHTHGVDETLYDDIANLNAVSDELRNGQWDKAVSRILSFSIARNKKSLGKAELTIYSDDAQITSDLAFLEAIANYREEYKALYNDNAASIVCTTRQKHIEQNELCADIIELLYSIVKRISELVWDEKLRRGGVDFADVELLTVELLLENKNGVISRTELCEEIVKSGEYAAILIDEYQDTNNLQDLIFKAISDTDDISIPGKNMFIVGDVKQAIYGFRQSNPRLFLSARQSANKDENANKLREVILENNYRSRKEVLEFSNFIFSLLMSPQIGEVSYSGGELLQYGELYDEADTPTKLLVFEDAEHIAVAKKIRSMLDEGVLVYDGGKYRPCIPSDFCILSRGKGQNFLYSGAFEALGLHISCSEINGYLKSREIALIVNLLKVIDNPMNDMAMLSVMLSPLFMFTDDEIAILKAVSKWENKLYQLILEASKFEYSLDESVIDKCRRTVNMIKLLRYYASTMPIEQLIRQLYAETDFYVLSSTFTSALQSQANLRLLLDFAKQYDNNSSGGLTGFLRYFDNVIETDKDFSQASVVTEKTNAVNVMTMHKSKGLEFPFVFLCNLKKGFREDSSEKLLLDSQMGIGLKLTDNERLVQYQSSAHLAISRKMHFTALSEELRLLYVAMTRAKEQLFVMVPKTATEHNTVKLKSMLSSVAVNQGINENTAAMAGCMLDWILCAMAFHQQGDKLLEEIGCSNPILKPHGNCSVEISDTDSAKFLPPIRKAQDSQADKERAGQIQKLLSRQPIISQKGYTKISVSEVVHGVDQRTTFFPQVPKLSHELDDFSATKKGTLTHRFMELCDFEKASESVDAELLRLVSDGHFTENECKGIYIDAIKKFFSGSFGKRVMASSEILREKQFMLKLSDLSLDESMFGDIVTSEGMIQGIADCIFREGDAYVLVDYKTDRVESVDELVSRYSPQLYLYKAAFELILQRPIKSSIIYSFYLSQGIDVDF